MSKTLILARHAKSSWDDPTLPDLRRPLNPRGLRDAPLMGKQLRSRGISPDLILASHAVRAHSTAELLATELGRSKSDLVLREAIYQAEPQQLLRLVHDLDDRLGIVLLVGHNPELTEFANRLGDLELTNIPTMGLVAFRLHIDRWSDVLFGAGDLWFFDYPKKYR